LRAYLDERSRDLDLLGDHTAWRHPLVATWFPDPPIDDLARMANDQDRYLRILHDLPSTLCHLDVHPANAFDAAGDTALIDWAFVGIGTLGEDAGNVIADAVLDFHVPPRHLDDLYTAIADGYRAGLEAAGWAGQPEQVRLAMAVTIAAKYLWIAPAILRAARDDRDQMNDRPIAQALAAWAPTVHFLLARAREVAELTGHRP
jgi:thiamine kinase-like enzyme